MPSRSQEAAEERRVRQGPRTILDAGAGCGCAALTPNLKLIADQVQLVGKEIPTGMGVGRKLWA